MARKMTIGSFFKRLVDGDKGCCTNVEVMNMMFITDAIQKQCERVINLTDDQIAELNKKSMVDMFAWRDTAKRLHAELTDYLKS